MEQQFQNTSSVDYSLKDGETIVLQLNNKVSWSSFHLFLHQLVRCFIVIYLIFTFLDHQQKTTSNIKKLSDLDVKVAPSEEEGNAKKESIFCIKPPPPPLAPLSPVTAQNSPTSVPPNINLEEPSNHKTSEPAKEDSNAAEGQTTVDVPDDDFGDFQTAGWLYGLWHGTCTFSTTQKPIFGFQ